MEKLTIQLSREVEQAVERLRKHAGASQVLEGTASAQTLACYYASAHRIVRHAPRLLRRSAEVLRERGGCSALIELFARKAGEESGHERWLEQDLAAIGYPPGSLDGLDAAPAGALYNAFHDHVIALRGEAFLGSAWVLESFAVRCAGAAADNLRARSGIQGLSVDSSAGVSFFAAHGEADREHVAQLLDVIDRYVLEPAAQDYVRLCAHFTGTIYADLFTTA